MKTFKTYLLEKLEQKNIPSRFFEGPLSFSEMRRKHKKIQESYEEDEEHPEADKLHSDPDISPKNLTKEHKSAIFNYTAAESTAKKGGAGSSENVNAYLKNKAGFKDRGIVKQKPENVLNSIKTLSSAFTPENTNRKSVIGYGAVNSQNGTALEKSKKGDIHHFIGVTSTSVSNDENESLSTARFFATKLAKNKDSDEVRHLVKYHILPGAGVSVAKHSALQDENEMILPNKAKLKYSHSEDYTPESGVNYKIHHVTVHPEQSPEEYNEYEK
jgi:hypothetical protein